MELKGRGDVKNVSVRTTPQQAIRARPLISLLPKWSASSITLIACPHPIGYFYKRADSKRLEKHPKGCGRWDCPYCGERKKRKLLDRIGKYYRAHPDQCRLLTLTLADNVDDERITEFWHRLQNSLKKYGIKFAYCWFKEFTKNGRRHLHVLIDKFIKKSLIKRLWLKATEGTSYIIKINHRPIRSAAGYISKYITKDVQKEGRYKRKERRYSFSHDFNEPKAMSTGEWAVEIDFGAFLNVPLATPLQQAREEWNRLRAEDPPRSGEQPQ